MFMILDPIYGTEFEPNTLTLQVKGCAGPLQRQDPGNLVYFLSNMTVPIILLA